jgi:hypothetical protein
MANVGLQLVIAVGVSILARALIKIKTPETDQGDPTVLSKRGTHVPYLIGRRKLGSVFAYAGKRFTSKEKVSGGKKGGGGGEKQVVFWEQGWHLLSYSGKGKSLREIQKAGKSIFKGSLTPETHPSGTQINLGKEGYFKIFWGEDDQSENTNFGNNTGVYSKWPGLASIYWTLFRMGTAPRWAVINYIFEVGIDYELLTQSGAYRPPTETPSDEVYYISQTVGGAGGGTGFFRVPRGHSLIDPLEALQPGRPFDVSGSNSNDGYYRVFKIEEHVEHIDHPSSTSGPSTGHYRYSRDIYPVEAIPSSEGAVTGSLVRPYILGEDDGYNPAHMIAQLLFGPYPLGFSLPHEELFNLESLEALGLLLNQEEFWGSVVSREEGSSLLEILGNILQDVGCFISLNPLTGLYDFVPIRETGVVAPHFEDGFVVDASPEIETFHGEKSGSRVVFLFEDQDYNYKENTIGGLDDDGEFRLVNYFKAKKVKMLIPTVFSVAAKAAKRRSQEEQGAGAALTLEMGRGARLLTAGMKFTMAGVAQRMICMSNSFTADSAKCKVSAVTDFVSSKNSAFEATPGAPAEDNIPAAPPAGQGVLEVPPYLSNGLELVAVPIARANTQVHSHDIWISEDDVTYRQILQDSTSQTGGVLTTEIPEGTEVSLPSGLFSFTELGPDITTLVLDLSGDDASWRKGMQLLVMGGEIMFLDGVVFVGNSWSVGRLLRARLGTKQEGHPIDSTFLIVDPNTMVAFDEPEIFPGNTIYVKAQAHAADSVPLASTPAISALLHGKGLVPQDPICLRGRGDVASAFSNSYVSGDDLLFRWNYRSAAVPKTGAGMQNAGSAQGFSPAPGEFRIELLTLGFFLQHTAIVSGSETEFAFTNAQLIAAFGSEPSFLARVTLVGSGYSSNYTEITMVKD